MNMYNIEVCDPKMTKTARHFMLIFFMYECTAIEKPTPSYVYIYKKATKNHEDQNSEVIHWEVPIIIGLAFPGIELLVTKISSSCMLIRSYGSFKVGIFIEIIYGGCNISAVQETLWSHNPNVSFRYSTCKQSDWTRSIHDLIEASITDILEPWNGPNGTVMEQK